MLLAATTLLGILLEDNEQLQREIIDGALDDIPVLGQQLANDPESLRGSFLVLVLGLATALWSATKAFVGLQHAQDDTWEVHVDHRAAMPAQRAKALLGILFIGLAQIGTLAISALVNNADLHEGSRSLLIGGSLVVNVAVMIGMFRFLTSAVVTVRDVWPGALTAGAAFSALHHFGTAIVQRITTNASDTYGQFALVLGIVTWLGFLSIATLMSVEFNAALVRYREGSLDRVDPSDEDDGERKDQTELSEASA
jgi:uncharacterized BrkB/YihY/UPF0761 family membrane protein